MISPQVERNSTWGDAIFYRITTSRGRTYLIKKERFEITSPLFIIVEDYALCVNYVATYN